MSEKEHIIHPFEPVYDERSRVLVLGSMPSPRSRQDGFYYGHPQNRFWSVLATLFDEPVPTTNQRKRDLVLRQHIALWDVLASCDIEGASDATIADAQPNDIARVLAEAPIEAVFCTGAKAAQLYAQLCEPVCGVSATRLPSTSSANAGCSLDELVDAYQCIVEHVHPFVPPVLDVPRVVELEGALAQGGTSLAELMDRAGRALAYRAHAMGPVARVCVLCGSGNNGGDGWVAAAELARMGHEVTLLSAKTPDQIRAQPAADAAKRVMAQSPVPVSASESAIEGADLIIDAILGTGFTGSNVKEPYATWILAANQAAARGARIVAADVPSGLSARTGACADPCIRADATVTMIVPKPGLNSELCGTVTVAPLAYAEPLLAHGW